MIIVPVILSIMVFVFLIGYFSMRNGRIAVNGISQALRNEITDRIQTRTLEFLDVPLVICDITAESIKDGLIDYENPREMENWFIELVKVYPQISSIYFGNIHGGLADAGRDTSGELYVIRTENYSVGLFRKLRIDSSDVVIEELFENPNFDSRTRQWFITARDSETATVRSDPFAVFTGDDISISTSKSVYDSDGVFLGVVSCDVFLSQLNCFLESIEVGETGFAFFTDNQGRILASSSANGNSELFGLLPAGEYDDDMIKTVGLHIDSLYGGLSDVDSMVDFYFESEYSNAFVQILPFKDSIGKSYYIVTVIPDSDYMEFFDKSRRDTLVLLGISLLLALGLGTLIARLITKPIHDLRSTVKDIADGKKNDFAPHWMAEVNELSSEFSNLTNLLNSTLADLQESKERMDIALKGTRAATWDWNMLTGEIQINERWAEMLGYSYDEIKPVTEKSWNSLTHPEDISHVYLHLKEHFSGESDFYEATLRLKHVNKSWIWVMDRGMVIEWDKKGNPIRMAGTHVDITPRKLAEIEKNRLQEQINKTQRLESIGQLAGGVAHDLNNLLTPIIGYSEMLLSDIDTNSDPQPLQEILRAGKSSQQLVNQLLAFGRKQYLQLSIFDVNKLISDFSVLIRRTIRENISISFDLCESIIPVEGDVIKLEQVLMNLAVNAQDAMPEGGTMRITTSLSTSAAECSGILEDETFEGKCIVLEVSDNGTGMSTETISKIFEPFFTSKGIKGTGLGLATVYGIISQHQGIITVKSELGAGTTFRVILPLSDKKIVQIPEKNSFVDKICTESILLVEDSDEVREIAKITLERTGFKIFEAKCGEEALEILKEKGKLIDLMLTDMIMPGISVKKLHDEAVVILPDLKIIYMSGYSGDDLGSFRSGNKSVPFISKPFSLDDLTAKVRSVLDTES